MLFEILFSFNSPCPYGWAIVITLRLSSFVSVSFWYFILFLRNLWADCIQTWRRCCLCGCLWKTFMWKKIEMWLNTNSIWMIIGLSVTKCRFLLWVENLRWPWTVGQNHRTLFVEITKPFKRKVALTIPCIILYQDYIQILTYRATNLVFTWKKC